MADQITTRSAEETKLLDRARQRLPGGVLGTSRYADDVGLWSSTARAGRSTT